MIGAIIGDIVGSRFEFNNTKTTDFELFADGCDYTDDSICTMAVADAILHNKDMATTLREWCRRYPNPMGGYGGSFSQWLQSETPKPYGSYGNGAGMRASACGFLATSLDSAYVLGEESAAPTHNHPEGVTAAQTLAVCIYFLRKGRDKQFIREYVDLFYGEIAEFKPFSNAFDETSQRTMPVAFSCYFASENFEDAIRKAMIVGGDSDTIGAIVGALAEAEYGVPVALRERALNYLPDEMRQLLSVYEARRSELDAPQD